MEIRFTRDAADFFWIICTKAAGDLGIDMPEHWVCAEGAHAGAVNSFGFALSPAATMACAA